MAFDKVFSGPPEDIAAPGSHQAPSLGLDVVNKQLYISAGSGWEEVQPASAVSGTFEVSGHSAFGNVATIDGGKNGFASSPPDGDFSPVVVNIREDTKGDAVNGVTGLNVELTMKNTVDQPGVEGMDCYLAIPSTNNTNFEDVTGINAGLQFNGGGSVTIDAQALGIDCENSGTGHLNAMHGVDDYMFQGPNASCTWMMGLSTAQHNQGTVSDTMAGVYVFFEFENQINATIANCKGIQIDTPTAGRSHTNNGTITNNWGIKIEDETAGTVGNWAIQTGKGLVELGDNLKVHGVIQSGIVYSAAGTALPSAATVGVGARAFVSDATLALSGNAGVAYVSGGANKVPVYSDGTAWFLG